MYSNKSFQSELLLREISTPSTMQTKNLPPISSLIPQKQQSDYR